MSFSELRLALPKDSRVSILAYSIWAAGVYPWSWMLSAGPDFLPRFTVEQMVGWQAYDQQMARERRAEHDAALAREVARAEAILAEQGMVLADAAPGDLYEQLVAVGAEHAKNEEPQP